MPQSLLMFDANCCQAWILVSCVLWGRAFAALHSLRGYAGNLTLGKPFILLTDSCWMSVFLWHFGPSLRLRCVRLLRVLRITRFFDDLRTLGAKLWTSLGFDVSVVWNVRKGWLNSEQGWLNGESVTEIYRYMSHKVKKGDGELTETELQTTCRWQRLKWPPVVVDNRHNPQTVKERITNYNKSKTFHLIESSSTSCRLKIILQSISLSSLYT